MTTFSVAINRGMYGLFRGARGLRQGDSLSLYLFGICIEYMARLLHSYTIKLDFHFHPKCKHLKIVHLAYADE